MAATGIYTKAAGHPGTFLGPASDRRSVEFDSAGNFIAMMALVASASVR
jgi:hypothetical protein